MKTRVAARLAHLGACGFFALGGLAVAPRVTLADEGGVSFWAPGFFGSLAAAPQQPGWSLATIYYHTSVSAGADVALAREFELRRIPANLTASLNASVNGTGDLGFVIPSYVFTTPVLGGQAAVALAGAFGRVSSSLTGTLSGTLATPLGGVAFTRSDSISDTLSGFSDLIPQFSLRWNAGVNNFMTYITGDVPVGAYDSARLSNTGIGHGAIDGGAGYTYFNPQTGHEFSAVAGLTYNFVNAATDYQNGVDFHLDMAAAQFLSKQVFVGAVGYVYDQLSADRGSAPILGPIESRVFGVGPQLGYLFPVGNIQGYLNLKAYFEFDSHNRPSGWNTWVTFAISPPAPPAATPPPSRSPMVYK
jgi:hypothetical protein